MKQFLFCSNINDSVYLKAPMSKSYGTEFVLIKEENKEKALDKYLDILIEEVKDDKFKDTNIYLWAKFYPEKAKEGILYDNSNKIYYYELDLTLNDFKMTQIEHKKSNTTHVCDTIF